MRKPIFALSVILNPQEIWLIVHVNKAIMNQKIIFKNVSNAPVFAVPVKIKIPVFHVTTPNLNPHFAKGLFLPK